MSRSDEEFIGLLGLVIILAWPVWEFELNPFSDITTLYYTSDENRDGKINRFEHGSFSFKVNADTQTVIMKSDYLNLLKLPECRVFDSDNWQCNRTVFPGLDEIGKLDGEWLLPEDGSVTSIWRTKSLWLDFQRTSLDFQRTAN
jgi:hypothetical protein